MVPWSVPEIVDVESVEYSWGEYLQNLHFEYVFHFSYTFHTFAPEAYYMQTALLCDAEDDAQSIKLRCSETGGLRHGPLTSYPQPPSLYGSCWFMSAFYTYIL